MLFVVAYHKEAPCKKVYILDISQMRGIDWLIEQTNKSKLPLRTSRPMMVGGGGGGFGKCPEVFYKELPLVGQGLVAREIVSVSKSQGRQENI